MPYCSGLIKSSRGGGAIVKIPYNGGKWRVFLGIFILKNT